MTTPNNNLIPVEKLNTSAQHILDLAKKQGATSAEVAISNNIGVSIQVRLGEVETLEHHRDQGVGITVYFGHKKGSASLSALDEPALAEAVSAACHIAKYTAEDSCAGLADQNMMAFNYPDLKLYYPWQHSIEESITLLKDIEAKGLAYDKRITLSEGANLSTHENHILYANSHGFCGHYPSSFYNLSCTLIAGEGDTMQRDYGYSVTRDPSQLATAKQIAEEAAKRTVNRLGGKRLTTRKTPVIFLNSVATGLISHFLAAIRGSNLYRKSSFLLDSLGKAVFPSHITIEEKPSIIKGLGSSPFDGEGVKTHERALVEQGILKSYLLNTYTARKLGMTTTGNAGGVHNIIVSTESFGLDTLLQTMGTGLLVTELMGQGINLITGDYSRGASGFWVEGGKIQYPVEEITIAGNLKTMFENIVSISNDIEMRSAIQTGSILINELMLAGE